MFTKILSRQVFEKHRATILNSGGTGCGGILSSSPGGTRVTDGPSEVAGSPAVGRTRVVTSLILSSEPFGPDSKM